VSEGLRELVTQGFTVLPALRDPDAIARLTRALDRLRDEAAPPRLHADDDLVLAEDTKVSAVGLTFFGLLGRAPEIAELFVAEDLIALLREALGPALELEQSCGVLSDEQRPFFFWHHHVGGIDGQDFRGESPPPPARLERLVCTIYATPLDEAHGEMLVHPRAVGDSLSPPHTPGRVPWPGATPLRAPAGSVVVLDEATWHAVTPMRAPGLRRFAAFFVRRAGLVPTRRVDDTVAPALAADPRLASIYRAALAVEGAARGRG
jgi:hypothetical protein